MTVYVGVFMLYRLKVVIYIESVELFLLVYVFGPAQLIANDSSVDMEQAGEILVMSS